MRRRSRNGFVRPMSRTAHREEALRARERARRARCPVAGAGRVGVRGAQAPRQHYYAWPVSPVTDAEYEAAYREDPEIGCWLLFDEVTAAGHDVSKRTERTRVENLLEQRVVVRVRQEAPPEGVTARRPGPRRPGAPRVRRPRPELAVIDRQLRAPDRGRGALHLCDQGRVDQPHRRLLHRRPDDLPTRG